MISMLHPRREVVALTIRLVIFVEDGQLFHERFLAAFPVQVRSSCEAILLGTATVDFRYWENLFWINLDLSGIEFRHIKDTKAPRIN
jgi:hypothetical protein